MRIILTLSTLLLCLSSYGQNMVQFTVSKPFCLLNFLETMIDGRGTSPTMKKYIQEHIPAADTSFRNIIADYSNLLYDYSYERQEYPESRRSMRSTADLVKIAAIQARTLAHFRLRISGILPNSEQTRLYELLKKAEPFYDKIITPEYEAKTRRQLQKLSEYEAATNQPFKAVRKFYNASWADDMPFTVALFPIPGEHGFSNASPHANALSLSVFTDETDYMRLMGIALHEMCHVLYDEQPAIVQQHYDSLFRANPSPYMQFAYNFFDEGLATAVGNGWLYKQLSGQPDSGSWYNNPYIDGFGHALFPMVEHYVNAGRTIDRAFIDSAIQIFGITFPKSLVDYGILFNRVHVYADVESKRERDLLYAAIGSYFQLTYSNMSTPILDQTSAEYMHGSKATQIIVIDRNHTAALNGIQKTFPEVAALTKNKADKNYVLSFFDKQKRPVILVRVENIGMLDKAFAALHSKKYLDEQQPYLSIK